MGQSLIEEILVVMKDRGAAMSAPEVLAALAAKGRVPTVENPEGYIAYTMVRQTESFKPCGRGFWYIKEAGIPKGSFQNLANMVRAVLKDHGAPMTFVEIYAALEAKGWQPLNPKDPKGYVRYLLGSKKKLFAHTGTGEKRTWSLVKGTPVVRAVSSGWNIVEGAPDGSEPILHEGPGFDFKHLVTVEGDYLLVRRAGDDDDQVSRIPIEHVRRLLQGKP